MVFGSVIMKKIKSWYIGPVIGAISDCHGLRAVIQLRRNAKAMNDEHIGAVMWKRSHAPDDDRAQHPDHHHRQKVVAPLNAQARHRRRREKQHHRDTPKFDGFQIGVP